MTKYFPLVYHNPNPISRLQASHISNPMAISLLMRTLSTQSTILACLKTSHLLQNPELSKLYPS